MKKTIYVRFDLDGESYQEAEQKLEEILKDCEDTLEQYTDVLETRKIVNKVKI